MTASNAIKDLQESNLFDTPIKGSLKLLKSAVIYGPNGAGKSNLIYRSLAGSFGKRKGVDR